MNEIIIAIILILALLLIAIIIYNKTNDIDIFKKYIYFDNNATTKPYTEVLDIIKKTSYMGNASSSYATDARNIINTTDNIIKFWIHSPQNEYNIVYTSGASESNNTIFKSLVESYKNPHIITTDYEHKTSLGCLNNLIQLGKAEVTFIKPNIYGLIDIKSVLQEIKPNTILISIMSANNEIGSLNPIHDIFSNVKNIRPDILCHTDAVQSFGKFSLPVKGLNNEIIIDAISISFHKLHGPLGIGALILSNKTKELIHKYPLIYGSQNDGLRGGTENIPGIAGAGVALAKTIKNRSNKNKDILNMRNYIINYMVKNYNIGLYEKYAGNEISYMQPTGLLNKTNNHIEIVFLGPVDLYGLPTDINRIPNTLLFSIVKYGSIDKHFCNIKLKDELFAKNIIISIGSACNTISPEPSHVLFSIGAPYIIRCGVIRVSLNDINTISQCKTFCNEFSKAINSQL